MQEQGNSLCVLETISQGMLAAKCRGEHWLTDASYAQTTAKHCKQAGIEPQLDIQATAAKLAAARMTKHDSEMALVQLYQGSEAAINDHQQSITLYNALAVGNTMLYRVNHVGGPAHRKQNQAAILALDMLRRYLHNQSL